MAGCAGDVPAEPGASRQPLSSADCEGPSQSHKRRVCHLTGDGYVLLEVSANAASRHLDSGHGHGADVAPGDGGLNCVCEPLSPDNLCVGAAAGTACSDDDACTAADACDGAGACASGEPLACDTAQARADGVLTDCQEYTGACSPDGGCEVVDVVDGAACSDGDPDTCEACLAGVCAAEPEPWCVPPDPCDDITFADPALEAAVRAALGLPSGPIEHVDALALTQLDISNQGVADLEGLQCFTNLWRLVAVNAPITDLSPLAPIGGLSVLMADNNGGVSDLSPLAGKSMVQLELGISAAVRATGVGISDLSPLAGQNLSRLRLERHRVTDLGPLDGMTNLWLLDLEGNEIADLGPLAGAPALYDVDLSRNVPGFTSLAPLTGASDLRVLSLSNLPGATTGITDLSPLAGKSLSQLRADWHDISDLSPLAGMPDLHTVRLDHNAVADAGPLASCPSLFEVSLEYNAPGIGSLAPFTGKTDLRFLRARNLPGDPIGVTDVTPLAGSASLRVLWLDGHPVADPSPLAGMCSLDQLWLRNGAYACPDASLSGLAMCGVEVEGDCP